MYWRRRKQVVSTVFLLIQSTSGEPKLTYQIHFPVYNSQAVRYDYRYAIDDERSGVVSDKWEERRGEYVKGAYSLLEPNGKVRTVNYEVDGDGGFHAIVKTAYPAHYLLSTRQYLKSQELYPQPAPDISLAPSGPIIDRPDDELPVNYHAINAAALGFQKLLAGRSKRINENKIINASQPPVGRFFR